MAGVACRQDSAFWKWFDGSVVKSECGQPQVVYHGSGANIEAFDPGRRGENFKWAANGFFFSASADVAADYALTKCGAEMGCPGLHQVPGMRGLVVGKEHEFGVGGANVMPVYLCLRKPLLVKPRGTYSPEQWYDYQCDQLFEKGIGRGADGIIVRPGVYGFEDRGLFVAFRPEQIKSAIGNRGGFDSGSALLSE